VLNGNEYPSAEFIGGGVMNNQYYLVKGLNKLAQGWHELGEDAVARSIYRYLISLHLSNQAEAFGDDAEFLALVQGYDALNDCSDIDEKELVHN
jgi:hypothetical protein